MRALGMTDEALQTFQALRNDERWGARARLCARWNCFCEKDDATGASRWLNSINARRPRNGTNGACCAVAFELAKIDIATKRFSFRLRILKNPAGRDRIQVLIATLFAIAESHLQMGTPETGDDYLEDFIEHHPNDPATCRRLCETRPALCRGTNAVAA